MHRPKLHGAGGMHERVSAAYLCLVSENNLPPTEQRGVHRHLESMSIEEHLAAMHEQTQSAFNAVNSCLPAVQKFVEALIPRMQEGGRLFYIGAGTSGRLGVLDASECPPTFGVEPDVIQGWIAGGDGALRVAVEGAEDNIEGAWSDLKGVKPTSMDTLIGIAASGRTPYVLGGIREANQAGLMTACITCNPSTALEALSAHAMVAVTGPEFVTGSTRLNAGTATKLVLNLISTTAMVQLGHVKGSSMIDMKLSNAKLIERGIRMIQKATGVDENRAEKLLKIHGSVRKSIDQIQGDAHA